jgi:hypothetical protein
LPVIFSSAQLWRSREPGYEELFNLFLDSFNKLLQYRILVLADSPEKTQTFENNGSTGSR